jgi:hypothetical protein
MGHPLGRTPRVESNRSLSLRAEFPSPTPRASIRRTLCAGVESSRPDGTTREEGPPHG